MNEPTLAKKSFLKRFREKQKNYKKKKKRKDETRLKLIEVEPITIDKCDS